MSGRHWGIAPWRGWKYWPHFSFDLVPWIVKTDTTQRENRTFRSFEKGGVHPIYLSLHPWPRGLCPSENSSGRIRSPGFKFGFFEVLRSPEPKPFLKFLSAVELECLNAVPSQNSRDFEVVKRKHAYFRYFQILELHMAASPFGRGPLSGIP